ncbi:hypothetical protein [Albatrosspox virus]|nr:hypothetical protein [Penguinpox virus 2]QRM16219.1 hypothetical protein [Albatrosspox virus]
MSTVIIIFLIVLCYLVVFFITSSKVQYNEILEKSTDSFHVAKRFKSPDVLETNSDINLRKSKLIEVRKRINSTKSEINKYGLLNT